MPRRPRRRIPDPRKAPTLKKGPLRRSKRVDDREKAARDLVGAINSLKAKAAAGFADKFRDILHPGETAPDETLSLELTGRAVTTAFDLLQEADKLYCEKAVDRRFLAKACDYVAAAGACLPG